MIRRLLIALVFAGICAQAHASSNGILTQGLSSSTTSGPSGSTSLSSLTSGISTNSIDSTLFSQTWNWSTLSTGTALSLTASTLTTGTVLKITSTGTGNALTLNGNIGGTFVTPVANGGTAQMGETTNGDSAYNIPATSNTVATSAQLTAARTWTLPAASTLAAGQQICVSDKFGGVSSSFNLTIAVNGTDKLNGLSSYLLNNSYQSVCLTSDGSSNWVVASTSGGPYSPALATGLPTASYGYNCTPQTLQWLQKSVDNVKTNTAQAFWFFLGDSTFYGEYSNNRTDTGNLIPGSFPSQLADILQANGINANSNGLAGGSANGTPNRSTTDSRLTFGTGWGVNTGTSIGGGFLEQSAQNTAPLSFVPTKLADTFKFLYLTASNGATFSADINGSGTTSYNSNGASGYAIQSVVGTLDNNTLNLKYVSGASANVYIQAIIAYNSAQASVNFITGGWGGSQTSSWLQNAQPYNAFPLIPVLNQDVTFIGLGNNDCNNGVPVATFKSNMQSLITQALTAKSGNTNVVLLPMNPTSNVCSQATQQSYVQAEYQLAASDNACFIDNYALFGSSYVTANALGLMGNSVHPNQLGYAKQAREDFSVIGAQ